MARPGEPTLPEPLPVQYGGTGTSTPGLIAGTAVTISGVWPNQIITSTATGTGGGTVTSVALTVPAFLNVGGSPITVAGTLAIGLSGTPLPVVNGGTGTTTPGLVAGTNVTITGTWPNQTINSSGGGGGGSVTHTAGPLTLNAVVIGNGGADVAVLASLGTVGQALVSNGAGSPPSFQTVSGTGTVTHTAGALTANAVMIGNGAADSAVLTSLGTVGQALVSNGAGVPPSFQTTFVPILTSVDVSAVAVLTTAAHSNRHLYSINDTTTSRSLPSSGQSIGDFTEYFNGGAVRHVFTGATGVPGLTLYADPGETLQFVYDTAWTPVTGNNPATVPTAGDHSANYTTVLTDAGKRVRHPSTDANVRTFTIDGTLAYADGTVMTFPNRTAQVLSLALTGGSGTLILAGTTTTGTRQIAQNGYATAVLDGIDWLASGPGVT